jgi:hypothetical protein
MSPTEFRPLSRFQYAVLAKKLLIVNPMDNEVVDIITQ